jgi:hypothetical protein
MIPSLVPSMFPVCSQFCSQCKLLIPLLVPSVPSILCAYVCEGIILQEGGNNPTGSLEPSRNTGNTGNTGFARTPLLAVWLNAD